MADLIDRQTAIETAIEAADRWDGAYSPERERIIRKFFDKVSAVQPDHVADVSKKVDGDCISRQAAIDALARMMPRSYTPDGSHPADEEIFRAQEVFADCIEALEILPSAQPEIIRCKDCKFAHITNDRRYCKLCDMFTDDYDQLIEMYFDSNFYCGYAERRTDG